MQATVLIECVFNGISFNQFYIILHKAINIYIFIKPTFISILKKMNDGLQINQF